LLFSIILVAGEPASDDTQDLPLTDKQDAWIKAQVASGDYTNDSEYFRDLIRRDQEQSAKFRALKAAIAEGQESGASERSVDEIWEEAETRHQARNA
jgi:antitoxin ParD1/3/4